MGNIHVECLISTPSKLEIDLGRIKLISELEVLFALLEHPSLVVHHINIRYRLKVHNPTILLVKPLVSI